MKPAALFFIYDQANSAFIRRFEDSEKKKKEKFYDSMIHCLLLKLIKRTTKITKKHSSRITPKYQPV